MPAHRSSNRDGRLTASCEVLPSPTAGPAGSAVASRPRPASRAERKGHAKLTDAAKTGPELRAHRKAAGLSQIELARRAGVGRQAIQYWEARAEVNRRGWALDRIREALGLPVYRHRYARARPWGLTRPDTSQARLDAEIEAKLAAQRERETARAARRRVVCGAQTRKGQPCRLLSEPGRSRRKFQGGMSTGPRTAEGRAKIAEAQRRRWAAQRSASVDATTRTEKSLGLR
jgi:transcriptional regulator with XRE-family HTH domain